MINRVYRLAILISSGRGAIRNILESTLPGRKLNRLVEPALIISSSEAAGGLAELESFNENSGMPPVPYVILRPEFFFGDEDLFASHIVAALKIHKAHGFIVDDYVYPVPNNVLAGFWDDAWKICPVPMPSGFRLPYFSAKDMYGLMFYEAMLRFARKIRRRHEIYAIVHRLGKNNGQGGIICRSARITVDPLWDAETLQSKMMPLQTQMLTDALAKIAGYRVGGFRVPVVPQVEAGLPILPQEEDAFRQAFKEARTWASRTRPDK